MEAAELDVALEELETRLERLRALYEQYFMGLEKIEPAIARKDVDRRIYVLRREKIRNTAKRFKLQTIIQRYNTFQQYWQRICREIENGTYKRHLLRAQKQNPNQLLTIAARKRLGRQASQPPAAAAPSQPPGADTHEAAAASAPSAVAAAPEPVAPLPGARPPGAPPLPPRRPAMPGRSPEAPAVASPAPAIAPAPAGAAPIAAKPLAAPAIAAAPKPAAPKFESLDLDMDFMSDWDPGERAAKPPAAKPAPLGARPAPPVAKPSAPVARPAAPKPVPPLPAAARAAVESVRPVAAPPRPLSTRPPTVPLAPRIPAAPRLPTAPSPRIPARPPAPAAPQPETPVRAPAPQAAPTPAKPVPAAAAKPAGLAPQPRPAAAPKPLAGSGAAVDDARLRELHSRLQQAKQQTKEANVSFEGLAKSIRATEAKLREQHKNRKIEFDVVIKDGKAVVKPIVR